MSDIRFNSWFHRSGTGGVFQDGSGRVGIGSTQPVSLLDLDGGTVTAGSFVGDGSSLTGIDATSLKDSGGNVKVQANTSGSVTTGVATVTSQITVGDSFIKNQRVGLGTTTTAGLTAGIGTAVGEIAYDATTNSVKVYKTITGWVAIDSTGDNFPTGIEATGGIIGQYTDPGPGKNYRVHTFEATGSFVVSSLGSGLPAALEYVVIAGGGGGGTAGTGGGAGGGGAGGYRSSVIGEASGGGGSAEDTLTATVSTIPVVIGAGGKADGWQPGEPDAASADGGPSTFGPVTSVGGGGGGFGNTAVGRPGGSGGGASARLDASSEGAGTANQGFPGGGNLTGTNPDNTMTGGGGAGGAGGAFPGTPNTSTPGGVGLESNITGAPVFRAGGGGGGGHANTPLPGGNGGNGGGGDGAQPGNNWTGQNGSAMTGGGGGGNHRSAPWPVSPNQTANTGGNGGSGVVIVRYEIGVPQMGTAKATGGQISFYNGKTIHTFVNTGTFTAPGTFNETVEYVCVAGGGGGGTDQGGGGGAGGYRTGSTPLTGPAPFAVTIGAGGKGTFGTSQSGGQVGASGANTSVAFPSGTITSAGGGGGCSYNSTPPQGSPGGSGGGGGNPATPGGTGNTPPTSPAQGFDGGDGASNAGGGGGGGGGVGENGVASTAGGDGGIGVQIPATFRNPFSTVGAPGPGSTLYWMAGGGGGGAAGSSSAGVGGQGTPANPGGPFAGGGNGDPTGASPSTASDGQSATGGGGGGGFFRTNSEFGAGDGGSGIVLLAYPT